MKKRDKKLKLALHSTSQSLLLVSIKNALILDTKSVSELLASMSNVLNPEQAKESEPVDIKYIRCVNGINDPILKDDLDQTNQDIEKKQQDFL